MKAFLKNFGISILSIFFILIIFLVAAWPVGVIIGFDLSPLWLFPYMFLYLPLIWALITTISEEI